MPSLHTEQRGRDVRARAPGTTRHARFLSVISAHNRALEAVAHRLCRQRTVAADLVQDTLERAWRRLDSLQDDARARAWLLQVMHNLWIDQIRRHRVEVPLEETSELPAVVDDEPSWWTHVTVGDLRAAIAQLEEPYRSVAMLHDIEGRSYRDIAKLLGIPSATAATRIHRAHRRLRALLQRNLLPTPAAAAGTQQLIGRKRGA